MKTRKAYSIIAGFLVISVALAFALPSGAENGDVVSYPIPYFTPPLSQHAKSLRKLAQIDADVIIPGHGPAWHDKSFLTLEADLFERLVTQALGAEQHGSARVEELGA